MMSLWQTNVLGSPRFSWSHNRNITSTNAHREEFCRSPEPLATRTAKEAAATFLSAVVLACLLFFLWSSFDDLRRFLFRRKNAKNHASAVQLRRTSRAYQQLYAHLQDDADKGIRSASAHGPCDAHGRYTETRPQPQRQSLLLGGAMRSGSRAYGSTGNLNFSKRAKLLNAHLGEGYEVTGL